MSGCRAPRGFVGEFLSLTGAFRINTWVAFLATTGVILSAAYALWLYRRIIFGKLEKASLKFITDLTWREVVVMTPLVLLTILFGFYPAPILDASAVSVEALIKGFNASLAAAEQARLCARAVGALPVSYAPRISPPLLPELILACGAMALLMLGVATKRERGELILSARGRHSSSSAGAVRRRAGRHGNLFGVSFHRRSLRPHA